MFIETSALTNENVTESFLQCARVILNKIESGNIAPYRMYSGIQCGRSLAANRSGLNQNENSADERIQKSSKGCAFCQT